MNIFLSNRSIHSNFNIFILFICIFGHAQNINAGTIKEIKPLSFGTIALKDNSSSYTMRVAFSGQISADPAIVIIESGHPAQWELSNFPQHTSLNVTFIVPSTQTQFAGSSDPASSQFSITGHHTFSPIITTDSLGNALFNVGATLTTSGSGFYNDATYFSHITIMVNY